MRKPCLAMLATLALPALSAPALVSSALVSSALMSSARADEIIEYPADLPGYPFARSYLSGRVVVIPPYRRVFPVRVYTTPQRQPYYNVPPYEVITPY